MRKALIGLVLAATVLTPFAAQAQDWRQARGERNTDGGEERAARIEQRNQQRQAQQAQVQAQVQVQQEAPRQQYQRRQYQPQPQQQQFEQQVQRQQYRRQQFEQQQQQQQQQQAYGQRHRYDNGYRGNWRGGQTNQGSIYPQAWQGDPNDPRLRHYQELERRNQQGYSNDRRNWRDNRSDWRNDRNGRYDWNRNWRNDNRYDWQRYRYGNRDRFRVGPYYSPYRNYGYNRFSIGVFLDSLFFDQRYWIGDPWQYRLPPAYPGTQWVRYYNDVLLVDVYSGEVIDVIYDFFW